MANPTATKTVSVANPQGLHLRPAQQLAAMATGVQADVTMQKGDLAVSASSALDIIALVASQGQEITISGEGPDAESVVAQLAEFIATDVTDPE